MKKASLFHLLFIIAIVPFFISCLGGKAVQKERYKSPDSYNFKFIIFNDDIKNPSQDRRCYYRIFIDKVEKGRTSTGLESQEKVFEIKLDGERHLVTLEKWVLDKKRGRYLKVNNVQQPKPGFRYFSLARDRILKVTARVTGGNRVKYSESFEKE